MPFDDLLTEDIDELDEEVDHKVVIRGRWVLDGATTLLEAAEMAREQADYFEQLHELGYELTGVIDDDYGLAVLN